MHAIWVANKRKISGLHPENKTCSICHESGLPKNINSAVGCMECHKEDMNVANDFKFTKTIFICR